MVGASHLTISARLIATSDGRHADGTAVLTTLVTPSG